MFNKELFILHPCVRILFSNHFKLCCRGVQLMALLCGGLFLAEVAHAQAPAILWTTNVGASVFAVDDQTNLYANVNGTVIKLDANGNPLQTNSICPVPSIAGGVALRDAGGNFYFAGNFDGTNDFGGITLVGGWINNVNFFPPRWVAGYPTCYLAKYAANGTLLWAVAFGEQAASNYLSDACLNTNNTLTAGFQRGADTAQVAQFSMGTGAAVWQSGLAGSQFNTGPVKVSPLVGTNGGFLQYRNASKDIAVGFFSTNGILHYATVPPPLIWSAPLSVNGKPVTTVANEIYVAGLTQGFQPILEKVLANGSLVSTQALGSVEQWILASDSGGSFYLAGADGIFSKFNSDGIRIWTTNYGSAAIRELVDASGNRFLQFTSNTIARIASDPPAVAPSIIKPPQSLTVFVGDTFSLDVTAGGTPPLYYAWQLNGTNIPNATNAILNFNSALASQAGPYSVVVSNAAGSITSSPPAMLRVKTVEIYAGNQLLTNGTYVFAAPPQLTIRSAFPSGSAFYTLNGSTPSFASTAYSGPFTLNQSATVRAIGYSADFTQSEEADVVYATVLVSHTLSAASSGGGWLTLVQASNPPPSDAISRWHAEGNMLDSTGTNNGVAEGGLAYASGEVGQAFSFNGTDADVSVAPSPTLNIGSSNGMTIVTWFKAGSVSTPASLVEWFDPSFSLSHYEGVTFTINIPPANGGNGSGCLVGNLQDTSGNFHQVVTPAGQFTTGTLNHTALTYDKTSGLGTLYLNGNVVAQTNLGVFTPETRPSNFKLILGGVHFPIGGHIAEHFAGLMDETALFGRALSSTEIKSLYLAEGGVLTNPPSGHYLGNTTVTIAAMPAPGWQFLHWLGDVSGTNSTIQISMDRDQSVYAVFGTTLSTTVVGNGQISYQPPGGVYAFGQTVRLTAIPQPGSYFGAWGNAASGNVNPLYFTVTNPAPTVSSIFGTTSAGQAAFTLEISGQGHVTVNPQGNVFSTGQSLTLTATPDSGQSFVNWSGDASGTQNPLMITLDQSKVVTANFTDGFEYRMNRQYGEGAGSSGFRFTILSGPESVYEVFSSTNLTSWTSMGLFTNHTGEMQVLDSDATNVPRKFYRIQP
jgi:hypothetical protein